MWTEVAEAEAANALDLSLENISAATFGLTRAGIDPAQVVTIEVTTDGPSVLSLVAPWDKRTTVSDATTGEPVPFDLDGDTLRIGLEEGERTLRIDPGS